MEIVRKKKKKARSVPTLGKDAQGDDLARLTGRSAEPVWGFLERKSGQKSANERLLRQKRKRSSDHFVEPTKKKSGV